jgi:hypothetical protein
MLGDYTHVCVHCWTCLGGAWLLLMLLLKHTYVAVAAVTYVCGCRALSMLAAPSMSVAASPETFPSELLAFSLADGRSGVLSVR